MSQISQQTFEDQIRRLGLLVNIPLKREMVTEMYQELCYTPTHVFVKAIQDLINEPPQRFNLASLKRAIASASPVSGNSRNHWNGTECEVCDSIGLIHEYRVNADGSRGAPYCYRCPKCRSNTAGGIPFYSGNLNGIKDGIIHAMWK